MEIRQEMASLRKLQPVTTGPNLAKDAQQLRPAVKDRPKINAASSPEAKIALFMDRFSGRKDVYARRWTSRKTALAMHSRHSEYIRNSRLIIVLL